MEFSENRQGNIKIVKIAGRIDQSSADDFQAALAPSLAQCQAGEAPLLLDFSAVDYISSVGLRALMLAAKQVKAQQGRIAIAALTPVVAEVFRISRFDMVIAVHRDVAAALASLS